MDIYVKLWHFVLKRIITDYDYEESMK